MVSEVPNQSESPLLRFRVRFRDGVQWTIPAATYERELQPDDLVRFYDAQKVENGFLRAAEVSAIAPDTGLDPTTPIIELQQNIKSLTARVDALENNLGDIANNLGEIVTRAVADAFTQRGL